MKKIATVLILLTCIFITKNFCIAQSWNLAGNAGTNTATQFIGTSDNKGLKIRTNNAVRITITSTGKVGIGNSTPVFKLDVKGSINTDSLFRINGMPVLTRSATNNLQLGDAATMVGIGTASPSAKFHLKSSDDASLLIIDANFTQNNTNPLIKLRNYAGVDILWVHSDNALNTFIGVNAGRVNYANGGATYNSFIGSNAGYSNTSGNYNTANGTNAMYFNNTGSNNSAFGSYSLYNNNSGYWNTANGESALRSNTSGHSNTASGTNSLYNNSTGFMNTAIGTSVLVNNSSGISNTGSGYQAMLYNNIGSYNTVSGNKALFNNTSGNYNTALGDVALYLNSTGSGNTGTGHYVLYSNSTGSYNTGLGYGAGCNAGQNPSNFTAIGYNAGHVAGMSNEIEIGNTSVSWIGGNANWGTYSDMRIKDNIQSNVPGLKFITKLNPVTYNLNIHRQNEMCSISDTNEWEGKYDIEKIMQTGFLAQEVEQAAKECNYDFNGVLAPKGNAKLYSIQYAAFVVPLVKSVQELDESNEELKIKNEKLESEYINQQFAIGNLQEENQVLKNEISEIKSCLAALCYNSEQTKANCQQLEANSFLNQNNPNPFKENTTIGFYISASSKALLKIFSMNGEEIKSYIISTKGKGQIEIAGNTLSPGVYTYVLIVDDKSVDTKQMVITK